MSLLRATQRVISRPPAWTSLSIRAQSTVTSPQTSVETSDKQSTEISTTIPSKEAVTADLISGAPCEYYEQLESLKLLKIACIAELRNRIVRIYLPTRNTMQSGGAKGNRWRIDFDILQGGGRWENPLMGWASS